MGDQNQDVPVEIITDILKRLPAKSLVRFRCVSKPWLSLLTNPNFIKSHLKRNRSTFQSNTNSTRLILSRYCDTLMDSSIDSGANNVLQAVELDFKIVNNIPYYVKGHSDGLLCIVANDGSEGMLLIYNPTIHEYRKLPSPDNFRSTREAIGIGYDPTIDDYKVVRVPSNYCSRKVRGYKPRVEVLSLKSNTWRRLPKEDTPPYFVEHIFQATEVNGGLYWFVEEPETLGCVILRFDLVKEKFKVVAPPPDGSISWIGPLKDWLCVVHRRRLSEVCVWGTKDDVKWTKIITTTTMCPTVVGMDHCLERMRCMPLCYTDNGAVLMCVKGERERFLTFDQKNNVFEHVDIRGAKHWLQETVYCESLVSPGVGVHRTEKARSSASRMVVAPAEGQEDEERKAEADGGDNSLELIRGLKRELSNLLILTIGFGGAQG